jgi:hypothetical protein
VRRPHTLPAVEQFGPIPSAGPYYISEFAVNDHLIASRNPNYHRPRPQPWDSIEHHFSESEDSVRSLVESGVSDYGFGVGPWDDLGQLYGPDSDAAARGLQQWFPSTIACVGYLPLNAERPTTFADVNMRKAVNYAIDRTALSATVPPYMAPITDQYLPPGTPGYEDIDAYPAHPNIELARDLAGRHPRGSAAPAHRLLPDDHRGQHRAVRERSAAARADRVRRHRSRLRRWRHLYAHRDARRALRPRRQRRLVRGLARPGQLHPALRRIDDP